VKVPISWLRDSVAVDMPLAELGAQLAITSCEVDRIVRRGVPDEDGNLGRYLVGRVIEAGKHPNADRLQLCRVDVGEGEPRQIVCGAWNFGEGATVAVALPGAVLPDGRRLERTTLRGTVSDGMILSEQELELGTDHTGILVLPEPSEPGTPLGDVLPLADDVLEIETGFNRPDLLAIYGIAREVAALTGAELPPPPGTDPERTEDEPVDVRIEDFEGCPRYIGRLLRDVTIEPSPPWLKARLLAAGVRPISNVVDVTNYAMVALGNPLHVFDHDRLAEGRIVVRRAHPGEELVTLDGTARRLDPEDLVIADAERAVALAGIMGGQDTEVTDATTTVLLEAANFEPIGVQRSSERHVRTEGSNRWEKGVDPYLAAQAAALATELIVELTGARWTGSVDVKQTLPERPVVRLRPERTSRVMGLDVGRADQREILGRLGFEVEDDWTVVVPTWRARDVTREADVIEEVARFHLPEVPFTLPLRSAMFGRLWQEQRLRRFVEDTLVGAGFSEAYTSSFVPGGGEEVQLANPLSVDQAALRTTLRTGLLAAAEHNVDVGNEVTELFEIARVYLPTGEKLPDERWRLAGVASRGFERAKGALDLLHQALKVPVRYERDDADPFLPGRAARFASGRVGELHPDVAAGRWGYFELELATLFAGIPERILYEDVITYPAVRQDLAFVVDESVLAGDLIAAAREAAGPEVRQASVFDVYRGGQIPEGKKSIALAVAFQSPERTLSDADAQELRERIVAALAERFGAELRA